MYFFLNFDLGKVKGPEFEGSKHPWTSMYVQSSYKNVIYKMSKMFYL